MMKNPKRPLVLGLAALMLFGGLVPLAPVAGAADDGQDGGPGAASGGPCGDGLIEEEAWIQLSQRAGTELTLSKILYLHVLPGTDSITSDAGVGFVAPHAWSNGIDAYVIDLGCEVEASSDGDTSFEVAITDPPSGQGIPLIPTVTPNDIAVRWFEDNGFKIAREDNPDGTDDSIDGQIPDDARYAVVWLPSGTPRGAQLTGQNPGGLYTVHFCFVAGGGTSCPI